MKKILYFFFSFIVLNTYSQSIGFKIGVTNSKFNASDNILRQVFDASNQKKLAGFNFGVTANFPIKIKNVSINPELFITQRGTQMYDLAYALDYELVVKMNNIEIPILLRYDYPLNDKFNIFAFAGPSFTFSTSGKIKETDGGDVVEIDLDYKKEKLSKSDIGIVLGGGVSYNLSKGSVFMDIRLFNGLKNQLTDINSVTVKNSASNISFGYKFLLNR